MKLYAIYFEIDSEPLERLTFAVSDLIEVRAELEKELAEKYNNETIKTLL